MKNGKVLKAHDSGCVVKDHPDGILVECPNGMRLIVSLYEADVVVRSFPSEDFEEDGVETIVRSNGVQFVQSEERIIRGPFGLSEPAAPYDPHDDL